MNKAITEGILFQPPAFDEGLDVWSNGDGTPGSDTYDTAPNAVIVPADQDFGSCLELQKTASTTRLRFMGDTPMLPGCYLQIRARIKAISGNLPNVRIAGWAGAGGGVHVDGVVETGPLTQLTSYGEVVEITAIVGPGERGGVDMPWGVSALYGHFGLDLTGPNGGIVRIDDIEISDISGIYLRELMSVVDVRDYGATGDGTTDDSPAFEAADQAANGRKVLVPAGTYHLASGASLASEFVFEGNVTMPTDQIFLLTGNFDLPAYIDAFGNEELAFRKAFQALLNNVDHESLDMRGRKVTVTGPIDMAAAVPNKSSYSTRRFIRNGQLEAAAGPAWDTQTYTSQATYDPSNDRTLTNVVNVANIPVGCLVGGSGVGREIYVRNRDVAAGEITLSAPLYDAAGTQSFTFQEFRYLLDFSGFSKLDKFGMQGIEIQCNSNASGIRVAPRGLSFMLKDCFVSRPKERGITSIGTGCQGMIIDQCQFLSSEDSEDVPDRTTIAINTNGNDVKLRNCRATRFRHFAVLGGSNSLVLGNHFFQGDSVSNGVRTAGLIVCDTYTSCTINGNYLDNAHIEWTNERDPSPDFTSGFSFSAMAITENIFLSGDVAPWFSYIVVRPHGTGHFLNGVIITGNKFRSINGSIDRADRVDTSFADLNRLRYKNVVFDNNTFHNVSAQVSNPLRIQHEQASESGSWTVDTGGLLPFEGYARGIDSLIPIGSITGSSGATRYIQPNATLSEGPDNDQIRVHWGEPVKGDISVVVRMDR